MYSGLCVPLTAPQVRQTVAAAPKDEFVASTADQLEAQLDSLLTTQVKQLTIAHHSRALIISHHSRALIIAHHSRAHNSTPQSSSQ